jgi:hypothetical protein
MADIRTPTMDAGHRSATAVGAGLEFVLIAFQHLLPEWLGSGLWWLLLFVGLALIVWGVWPFLKRVITSSRSRLIPIIMMVSGIFLFLGGAVWYGINNRVARLSPPIGIEYTSREYYGLLWRWPKAPNLPLGVMVHDDGHLTIRDFSMVATNVSDHDIRINDAYIISSISGVKITLQIRTPEGDLFPEKVNPIEPKTEFAFVIFFGEQTIGIPEEQFLAEWGSFRFVAAYSGVDFQIPFDLKEVKSRFDSVRPPPKPPMATKRSE